MTRPILAQTTDSRRTKEIMRQSVPMVAAVEGGLCIIGKQAPYFTITLDAHRAGFPDHCQHGGAAHELIRALFGDRFDDLIALHLSNADGVPMHAVANGAYWLRGYFGGLGARFHGGNNKMNFDLPPQRIDPAKPWITYEHREPTRLECLGTFAKQWRIDQAEAMEIARDCYSRGITRFEERLADHAAAMAPRWKEQAEACKAKHALQEFTHR